MKKSIFAWLLVFIIFSSIAKSVELTQYLPPMEESRAFQLYRNRPQSEMSKLVFLMDRFRGSDLKLVFDGREYDSNFALTEAKKYIAKNYRKQEAERWIKENAYRSPSAQQIIYIKYPNGKTDLLRDILLSELALLKEKV